MEQNNIIQTAYNLTNQLLNNHTIMVKTTTGREIKVDYIIEEDDCFIIHSIRTPNAILEQEIYVDMDEDNNIIQTNGTFNKGLVHSFIVGLIRNY